jgi:hypothetical protein
MKALFILYPQNVSKYQEYRMTDGYRFIDTVKDDDQAWKIVNNREDVMTDDDGTMKTDSGRIVWELGYNSFDFGDYFYITYDLDKLQPNNYSSHGNMWKAIKRVDPWNINEIEAILIRGPLQ